MRLFLDDIWYVNMYLADQAYGGAEEGGWYYSVGTLDEASAKFDDYDEAVEWSESVGAAKLAELNEGRPGLSTAASQGRYIHKVEDHPGRNWPTERPHYE
jgi:hypothetical protein